MPQDMNKQGIGGDIADKLLEKVMADMEAKAEAKAMARAESMIEAANARVQAAEQVRDMHLAEAERLKNEIKSIKESHNQFSQKERSLRAAIDEQREDYEEKINEQNIINAAQKQLLIDMERKMATMEGRLAEKAKPVKQVMPTITPQPIPSFEITPVRSPQGDLLSAIVKPVGGN